jgi:uracil-DNA glycosylase
MTAAPFAHTAGPQRAHTVFVGEAFGAEEEEVGQPFVGQSGREFARMLGEAWQQPALLAAAASPARADFIALRNDWLNEHGVLLTNVFALRPQNNNLAYLCCSKEELPNDYTLGPVRTEAPRYIRGEFLPELERLRSEIMAAQPNLVVALGSTALWALLGTCGIGAHRGTTTISQLVPGQKLLGTYHPAGIMYQWSLRSTMLADLMKAENEARHADIIRPVRHIHVCPDIEDVESTTQWLLENAKILSPDIETMKGQIRCIGFAWTRSDAIVIPFIHNLSGKNYWDWEEHEMRAWACVRRLLESDVPKVGQNFIFDLQYLTRAGIRPKNCQHDTMLLHHVLYPELPKGLGFLASIYCNDFAHKLLRKRGEEELKRDE